MLMPMYRRNFFDYDLEPRFVSYRYPVNTMKADIEKKDNNYIITADIPGVKKEDLDVQLKNGYLTIKTEAHGENEEKDEKSNYIHRERFSSSYSRSFYVGEDLTEEDIKAKYDNGTLTIEFADKEAEKEAASEKHIVIE